jgi:pimeloyl-ACP methyl ester carboxylesterase
LGSAVWLLCNLSGFGARSLLDRWLSPRVVAQRVEVAADDGETITVEVSGAGKPLLLIHGLGGSRRDWDDAVEHLSRGHRVHTLDLRGHGSRATSTALPTLEQMARDIAVVIERLGLDRPVLAGHSMGALVVMKYIHDHGPDKISGVCLIDQSPRITVDEQWRLGLFGTLTRAQIESALARLRCDFVETVVAEVAARLAPLRRACRPDGLAGRALRWTLARMRDAIGIAPVLSILDSLARADLRRVVENLSVPALVVLGGASHHYGGLPLADYYRNSLARGTVTTYAASAHSPHRQEPERFAADLSAFATLICG